MGTSSSLTEKFAALRTDRAYQSILLLRSIIKPNLPEQKLWFEVLARAVMDIGRKDHWNSDYFFKNDERTGNASDALESICEVLNTAPSFVVKVLGKCEIWPPQRTMTANLNNISTRIPAVETKMEYLTHENDEIINQTVHSDSDFSYNPDVWYGGAGGL